MEATENLQLPYIMPSQAQKHVTHNEAIRALDALVQLCVADRDLASPPATPEAGRRYVVAAGASGAWAGQEQRIAAWQDGAWAFFAPLPGWLAWVEDEARLFVFDGAGWSLAALANVNPVGLAGINTTADATDRLAVKSHSTRFDHDGSHHRLKINKAAAGDTASVLFQRGYGGHAEIGLAGDDDLHLKVSADGIAWTEALRIGAADGRVKLPAAPALVHEDQVATRRHIREILNANRTYYVRSDGADTHDGLANTAGGALLTLQAAFAACLKLDFNGYSVTISVQPGTYASGLNVNAPWVGGNLTLSLASGAVIDPASGHCISISALGGIFSIGGSGKLQNANAGCQAIQVSAPGIVNFSGIAFGQMSASGIHIYAIGTGVQVTATGSYGVEGGGAAHMQAYYGAMITCNNRTVTLTGVPAFTAYGVAVGCSVVRMTGNTFSGSATGARHSASRNGVIWHGGSTWPGSAAGSETTGAQAG